MGQVKIYAHLGTLGRHRDAISTAVHRALVEAFDYPVEKKFQRFFSLNDDEFLYPPDRGPDYLIIEVLLFPGRSSEAKKSFYRKVLENLKSSVGLGSQDVEIVLIEAPLENWSIRGLPGDELKLNYKIEV